MEQCLLDLAKNEVQSLMNLVKNEAQYLCCFNSFVENFEQERKRLAPKHIDMNKKINKARGVFSFKSEALDWKHEADDIINIDTTTKKKCFFDLCPNCWWQYWRGKELAKKTECTKVLLGRSNTNIIAGKAYLPIKEYFFPSQEFVHFKSRELEFQDLRKALEDGNCNMVGLQGMGGTGKTYMAKKVGSELEGSRFDEVFLLEVSILPDFNKLRRKFVEYLRLPLEEWKEEEYSMIIWITLLDMKKKLLIILDDVWEAFDLKRHLGIPCSHHQHKGCSVLITTRKERVCVKMECQIIIKLETLNDKDALDLFQKHVGNINDSSRGLKGVPEKIVKHCGGVPIAIAAIAEALKGQPTSVWKDALKSLKDCPGDQNLTKAYKCLDLSYCNLKNEKAKVLFLISSLFPKGFEVPEQLLSKIGIGLGSSGDNNKYHATRIEVLAAIMELKDSTLLFNSGGKFVMHDLIYDVALQI